MSQANLTLKLSALVVSFNAPAILERCLVSLEQQTLGEGVEVLVVRDWDAHQDERQMLQHRFRNVKWIEALQSCTVPKMRRLGIAQSRGEVIALLEDDCVVPENWCDAVLTAHQSPYVAIGGAVEPGNYTKGLDWGIYFCEYVRFMQPFEGDVRALPGNNVSYKRAALLELLQDRADEEGFYEVFVNWALQQAGQPLKADPALVVHNVNSWKFSNIFNVPFHHGRGFAGMRLAGKSWWRRLPFLGLALVLPLIQVGRITKQVLTRKRYVLRLVQALPGIVLFSISWSAGEFVGYLLGSGKSLEYWR